MAKAGSALVNLYNTGSDTTGRLRIQGSSVQIDAHATGDLNAYVAALQGAGFQVQSIDALHNTVEGYCPINQLLNVAELPQTLAMSPVYAPIRRA